MPALPWHRLGTALEEADLHDWPTAGRKAGIDWTVELVPLLTADTQAQVTDRAVRRTSDARVLGVVGPRYAALQNTAPDCRSGGSSPLEDEPHGRHQVVDLHRGDAQPLQGQRRAGLQAGELQELGVPPGEGDEVRPQAVVE
jgi:hypothetical protein